MAELVTITIDGTPYQVEKGIPLLLAAERAGVRIPHLCYYEGTSVFAGCRVCVVQIDNVRGMPTSCTTPTADGQVVWTRTEEVLEMQRGVMALIMADHPDRCLTCHRQKHCGINDICLRDSVVTYRCLTCAKNKRCEFQSATEELEMFKFPMRYYQEEHAWYGPGHVETPIRRDNPFIELDFNECILCARCVRTCDEVRGLSCYEMSYKGPQARIDTSFGLSLQAVGCDGCGACIDACPVNTIMDRPSKWAGPSQRTVTTTCPHCGDGCQLDIETKRDKLLRVTPNKAGPANHGFASARGRYGLGFIHRPDRLTAPLVKREGTFVEVSWDEALEAVNSRLSNLHGSAFGAVASPKATNEENYALQKFTREVMESPNIDHYARIDEAAMIRPLVEALGHGAMTNSLDDLAEAACLLVFASDTSVTHPIAAWRARQVARFTGGTLIVADPRHHEMADWAHCWLRYRPGTEVTLIAGLVRAVVDGDLATSEGMGLPLTITVEDAAAVCGVEVDALRDAARAFAKGPSTVVFDAGITQYNADPSSAVAGLIDLCLLTGNIGRPGAGIATLRGASNQQGTEDVGCMPHPSLPLGTDPQISQIAQLGRTPPPRTEGLRCREMLAEGSPVRAMILMGVDPVADDPARRALKAAVERLEFLVVMSEFMTPTAQLADVVLPLASFAEQEGTFTSTERRVQRVHRIFDPVGGSRPGWSVIRDLAARMGHVQTWPDAAAVFVELAAAIPSYAGISYQRLDQGEALQWPCPAHDHPGTPLLYAEGFAEGFPRYLPFEPVGAPLAKTGEYPLVLASGRDLVPYHKEVLTRQSDPTTRPYDHALSVHPSDAERFEVTDGTITSVATTEGSLAVVAKVTEDVPEGVLYVSLPLLEDTGPVQGLALVDGLPRSPLEQARIERAVQRPIQPGRPHEPQR